MRNEGTVKHPHDMKTGFLLDVHAKMPGMTERSVGAARTADGLNSYQVLCRFAGLRPGSTVVDLACGNGPLCEVLADCVGEDGRVIGVDLSESELRLARVRLAARRNIALLNEPAGGMSLPNGCADAILCHMALMLFSPLETAVREIGRVLKGGGLFAAVVPTLRQPGGLFKKCSEVLSRELQRERQGVVALSGSVVRMGSVNDLAGIFSGVDWRPETIVAQDVDVSLNDEPEALVERVAQAFYSYQRLPSASQRRVKAEWGRLFEESCDASRQCRFSFPLSAFVVWRKE